MTGRPKTRARGGRRPDEWWPGNTAGLRHGACQPRRIEPLATTFTAQLLEAAPWCDDPAYADTVATWAWTRARAELIRAWLNERGVVDEDTGKPRSGQNLLDRLETRLDTLGERLALTPRARVALGIDLTIQRNIELEGRVLAGALDAALGVLDQLGLAPDERLRLHQAANDRAHAHLAGEPAPELPAIVEPEIPEAEVVPDDDDALAAAVAAAEARRSRSPSPDGADVRTDVGPVDDAPEDDLRAETPAPATSTGDGGNVVKIKTPYNPNPGGGANPWRTNEPPWSRSMFD